MAKNQDTGIVQLKDGTYSCRIYRKINGKQYDLAYRKNEKGEKFTTKKAAREFRERIIAQLKEGIEHKEENGTKPRITFQKLWDLYIEEDCLGKASSTIRKHSSVWKNHIEEEFSNRYITGLPSDDVVTVQDINNFLTKKYRTTNLNYHYIESFLKLFYLFYNISYRRGYIDLDTLTKFTKDKKMRISMPKINVRDLEADNNRKVEIYDQLQIEQMANIFKETDLETAFLFGIYCGLRESEVFGLSWDDFNEEEKTITVNKQLIKDNENNWCISRVKTLKSNRVISVPDDLVKFLVKKRLEVNRRKRKSSAYRNRASEIVIDIRDDIPTPITGFDFINRSLVNTGTEGKLLTVNSLKYYGRRIQEELGFSFKFHKLRKTCLTRWASKGMPINVFKDFSGHIKLSTSMEYYIGKNEDIKAQTDKIINDFKLEDETITVDVEGYGTISIKKSELERIKKKR